MFMQSASESNNVFRSVCESIMQNRICFFWGMNRNMTVTKVQGSRIQSGAIKMQRKIKNFLNEFFDCESTAIFICKSGPSG